MKTPPIPPSLPRAHLRAWHRSGVVIGLIAAGSVALAGCGSDKAATSKQSNPTFKQSNPTFTLNEFTIKLDRPTLPQGKITLTVNNVGREEHELVLVKANAVSELPTKSDGSIDEEKIPASAKAGEIGHVAAHGTGSAAFDLAPGSYVAFCNIIDKMGSMGSMGSGTMMGGSGHVHFALGMHQLITVK